MKIIIKTEVNFTSKEIQKMADEIREAFEEGVVIVPPYTKVLIVSDDGKVYPL